MPSKHAMPEIPEYVTAETIGAFTGYSRQRILQFAIEEIIPKSVKGKGFPFQKSVRAIFDYRTKDEGATKQRERKNAAEADRAEADAMLKLGKLEVSGQRRRHFQDGVAQLVRNISNLKGYTDEQKDEIFAAARAVKFGADDAK